MLIAFSILGCRDKTNDRLVIDPNGFAYMNNDSRRIEETPILRVGVGDSFQRVSSRNPLFSSAITRNAGDEMRLALQSITRLQYDDSDLKFEVCARSASVDGNRYYKDGAAFIGLKLCESTVNDYHGAIQLAQKVVGDLLAANPGIKDLREFYMTADQAALTKLGGRIWQDVEQKRQIHDSYEKLDTWAESVARFEENRSNPIMDDDGRPRGTTSLVAIYAGKYAIIEIGISSQLLYGWGNELTPYQQTALAYTVAMHFRLRADVDAGSIAH